MNVASLELCKELHELSGWEPEDEWEADAEHEHWQSNEWYDHTYWVIDPSYSKSVFDDGTEFINGVAPHLTPNLAIKGGFASRLSWSVYIPAYDLGFLLRKLPRYIDDSYGLSLFVVSGTREHWVARYDYKEDPQCSVMADTPEDTAAKLCIELLKQGILQKEEDGDE